MVTLYGIKNCDTVKKALRWLADNHVEHSFHDFRVDGLEQAKLETWLAAVGMDTLVNKRSTTWKQLPESTRDNFDEAKAVATALQQPTLIKRPVLEYDNGILVGFKADEYQAHLV